MSNIDILILIPLIPAVPVVATWWLPWESWLPKKLPRFFLGPYLLYAAFAAWRFKLQWWCVLLIALFAVVVLVWGVLEKLDPETFAAKKSNEHSLLEKSRSGDPPQHRT